MKQSGTLPRGKFLSGVLVLTSAALFTKVVGLFYKIPLLSIVGVEGMAFFLSAYHVYSMLFVLCTAGLPAALSLQVSAALAKGDRAGALRVLRVSAVLFLSLGALGSAALSFFAPAVARGISMPDAEPAIVAIAPALVISTLAGALKGYFQGHQYMVPSAIAEVLESAGKLGFGLLLATRALSAGRGVPYVAAAAIFGITLGQLASLAFLAVMLCITLAKGRRVTEHTVYATADRPPLCSLLAQTLAVALPITVAAAVPSLVSLFDTALISGRLQRAGLAPSVANAMYSSYGNLAMPLYNLVPSLLTPVSMALMPLLGRAMAQRDQKGAAEALRTSLHSVLLLALPATLAFSVMARPILILLYGEQQSAVGVAAPLLSVLALSVLPTCLLGLVGAALQALGHPRAPLASMLIGAALKLSLEWVLLVTDGVLIMGAPISTLACNLLVLLIELYLLRRWLPLCTEVKRGLILPFLASLVGVVAGAALYLALLSKGISPRACALFALPATAGTYLLLVLRCGLVTEQQLLSLPCGKYIVFLLKKEVKDDTEGKTALDRAKKGIHA